MKLNHFLNEIMSCTDNKVLVHIQADISGNSVTEIWDNFHLFT